MSTEKDKWLAVTCLNNELDNPRFYFRCRADAGLVTHEVTTLVKKRFSTAQDALKEYDKLTPAQQSKVWFIEERVEKRVCRIQTTDEDPDIMNEFSNTNFRHSLQIEKVGWKPLWK